MFDDSFIHVMYNSEGNVLIYLGDKGVSMSRMEAEQLFVDLGHCLQDMDVVQKENEDVQEENN